MSPEGSVTHWLAEFKSGNAEAAQRLWERYFRRLVGLARSKLRGVPRRAADEEDVALSAFDSFCRAAENGRFPRLHDRDDLWQVLVLLTARKAVDLRHYEGRAKRGGGAVRDEQGAAGRPGRLDSPEALGQVIGREPTPELPPRSLRSASGCSANWATPNSAPSPSGRWKGTASKSLPRGSTVSPARWAASSSGFV